MCSKIFAAYAPAIGFPGSGFRTSLCREFTGVGISKRSFTYMQVEDRQPASNTPSRNGAGKILFAFGGDLPL
jgi:hypothetical protein